MHSELIKSDQFVQIISNLDTVTNEFEDAFIELNNFINNKYSALLNNYLALLIKNVSTINSSLV